MNTTRKAVCFRILTIIISVLIWLVGAGVLGFSLYMRFDYWMNHYVQASDELTKYTTYVYVFIATGAVVILFTIVGVYGAARPDKIALIVYLIFLPLILCLLVGGGVYAYIYREEIENTVKNSQLLVGVVQKRYGTEERPTVAMDYMQRELLCCGGTSFTDYKNSLWGVQTEHKEYRENKAPLSCCSDYWLFKDQPNEYKYCSMYVEGQIQEGNQLPDVNSKIYKTGCGEALVKFFQKHIVIAASIAFSVVALLVLAIIFVSLLLFYLRKSPLPRQDDVVYEMARTQEKSPYPARGGPYANLYQS